MERIYKYHFKIQTMTLPSLWIINVHVLLQLLEEFCDFIIIRPAHFACASQVRFLSFLFKYVVNENGEDPNKETEVTGFLIKAERTDSKIMLKRNVRREKERRRDH